MPHDSGFAKNSGATGQRHAFLRDLRRDDFCVMIGTRIASDSSKFSRVSTKIRENPPLSAKIHVPVLILLAALLTACGGVIPGRASPPTPDLNAVGDFTRVEMAAAGEMHITQGETPAITIQGDRRMIRLLDVYTEGDTLHVAFKEGASRRKTLRVLALKYEVVTPNLEGVILSGSANIRGESISGDRLEIVLAGGGNITFDDLQVKELHVSIPGAGVVKVSGQVESQTVQLAGLGRYEGEELQSATASVDVSGAGSAAVWVTETLDASLTGVGSVNYYGDPEVTSQTSGLGSVKAWGPKETSE
jgi:hypothetical protein